MNILTIVGLWFVILAILIVVFGEPSNFAVLLFIVGILITVFSLESETETLSNEERDTKLIQRYQQGDYSLEVRIDGDKVDTLYIFK